MMNFISFYDNKSIKNKEKFALILEKNLLNNYNVFLIIFFIFIIFY